MLGVLLVFLLAGVLLFFGWLPGKLAREAEARLRQRGWDATVATATPGLMSVTLRDVALSKDGVDASLDQVAVDSGPLGLAFSGSKAIEEVALRGGRVEIHAGWLGARSETTEAREDASARINLRLDDVELRFLDEHGILARATLSGDVRRGEAHLEATQVRLGEAPSHEARVVRADVEARRSDSGWQIAGATLDGLELRIGETHATATDTPDEDPLSDAEAPTAADGHAGADPDSAGPASGSQMPPSADGVPQTRARVAEFFSGRAASSRDAAPDSDGEQDSDSASAVALEDGSEGSTPEGAPTIALEPSSPADPAPDSHPQSAPIRLLERFADGAKVRLAGFRAVRLVGAREEPVIQQLDATLERQGDKLHLVANGQGQGGTVRCDLAAGWDPLSLEGSVGVRALPFDVMVPFLPILPWYRPQDARLDLDVEVEAPSASRVDVTGTGAISRLSFAHHRLASTPVRDVAFEVAGKASLYPAQRKLLFEDLSLTSGRAEVKASGMLVDAPDHYEVELHAELPPTVCNDAVGAIPRDLLAETAGFSWQGNLSGRVDVAVDSRSLDDVALEVKLNDQCTFVTVPAAADLRRVRGTFIHRVQEPDGSVFEMSSGPGSGNWTPLAAVSPYLIHAVVGHEDGGFFGHEGFAVYAIRGALKRNLQEGRYVVGASTITMQLAKNLFLRREKTLARKVQEVLLTWWLESALTKAEILELYLNVIEYSPGVYGVTRAAEHYFGREPRELSPTESAYLATILPNPKGLQASYQQGSLTAAMRNRISRFLSHLHERNRIDAEALAYGMAELDTLRFGAAAAGDAARELPTGAAPLPVPTASTRVVDEAEWEAEEADDPWFDWGSFDDEG